MPNWTTFSSPAGRVYFQRPPGTTTPRHHILTQVAADHTEVIKLLPPLTIGEVEVKLFLDAFAEVLDEAHHGSGLMWDFGRTLVKQAVTR